MPIELTNLASLRALVQQWRAAGESVALVPTMGALHAGHISLVRAAQAKAKRVVVSIFVNPTQFGPSEDFSRYPRPRAQDVALLAQAGVDAAWLPTVEAMYPQGFYTSVQVSGASEGLDGAFRPGHFNGVATVVTKLLLQVMPDIAIFGEKDYQQLCVIKQVAADLMLPVQIIGAPTLREPDGLALSSRNQYLSAAERALAPQLHAVMNEAARAIIAAPTQVEVLLVAAKNALMQAGFTSIDYLELRSEDTLATMETYRPSARLLAAAWLGSTRLIDNIKME